MKKRYTYYALAAALVLSACGNGDINIEESTTPSLQTEMVETTAEVLESTEAESESVPESGACEELPDEEVVYHVPLNVGLTAEYEGEWDDKGPIITADSSKILILDDGYEQLKTAIETYNERNWQEVYSVYLEHLDYAREDVFPEGTEISISREVELTRADSKVLSFINAETAFLGGAHGSYYENGEVFNSETGEKLELTDVVTDLDAVYQFVTESLKENYEKESFFEGYEEWLEEMFYEPGGAMSSPLEWILTMEGMEFRFSPYVLGPWVAGTFEVKIPYMGNEDLFREEYLCTIEHPIRKIEPNEEIYVDTDGDGIEDKVWFSESWSEDTYCTTVTVNREGEREDGSGFSSTISKDDIYGTFAEAYLLYSEEETPYLYLEFLMDNDWRKLEIVRLAETENFHSMSFIDGRGTSVYGHFISDPNQFALYDRLDILGTYMAYKNYRVGEDGMPVSNDEIYNIVSYHSDWRYALTAKREIPVLMHAEDGGEKIETTLPKGTRFRPRKTDAKTMVEMELEDGRRCDILVERNEGEHTYYIDGVSEYDCFGDVPYAG